MGTTASAELKESPYELLAKAFEKKSLEDVKRVFEHYNDISLPLRAKAIQLAAMFNFGDYYRTQDTSVIKSLQPEGVAELIELITDDDCLCALLQIKELCITNKVIGVHLMRALRGGQILRATLLLCREASGDVSSFMDAVDENLFKIFTYSDFAYSDTVVNSQVAMARLGEISLEFSDARICDFVLRYADIDASYRMRCADNEILAPIVRDLYPEQIGQNDLDKAFLRAFKNPDTDLEEARDLLASCSSPNLQFGAALFSASANRRYDLVELLASDPRTELDVLDGYALNSAIHSRDKKLIELFLGTGKFTPSARQQKLIDTIMVREKPKEEKRGFFTRPLYRK